MDRREQIAHLAATREEEMLLVRVCEKLDTAVQRDIPAATNFLSKREQMLVCEVLRGAPIRFFGGLSTAEREISCYLPDYLDEDWLTARMVRSPPCAPLFLSATRSRTAIFSAR